MTWLLKFSLIPRAVFGSVFIVFIASCTAKIANYHSRPVVRVNDETLTAESFSELLASRLKVFNDLSAKDSMVISQAKNAIIQDFIVRVVTDRWAQNNKLFVRKEQVDAELEQLRKNYPDDISLRRSMAIEGVTYEAWENRIKYSILEKMVLAELRKNLAKPNISDQKFYYQAHLDLFKVAPAIRIRQVVVDTDVNAQKIKKELSSGKSIAELAKKYSITPESQTDGDIGWIEKGSLEIFDNAFKLGVGQRSQILKSPYGYHILEVTGKRPAKQLSFEESQKKVEMMLLAQAEQEAYSSWLEEQILKSRVFKDDELISKISVQTRSLD